MQKPEIPANESDRQAALDRYNILDTMPELVYDELTKLAADICGTPIALISLIDYNRQWFKSRVGLNATETPREISFCGHAVAAKAILNIPDASQDPRFADNPLVVDDPNIRFYAGVPLITEDSFALGTLCVIDRQPRNLTDLQIRQLEALSRLVISQFELRLKEDTVKSRTNELQQAIANLQQENQQRLKTEASLRESQKLFASLVAAAPVGIFRTDTEGNCIYVNERWQQISGITLAESLGFGWLDGIHPSDRKLVSTEWETAIAENRQFSLEYRFQNKSGQITWGYGQAVAERDQFGEIIGYVGTITDISDRKQAEEQAQHRLDILEAARDIIASIDFTGKVTFFNQAGRALLGIAPDEDLSQTNNTDYHSPEMADFILKEAIPQCIQNGFWSGETSFLRRNGSEFPVLQTIVCHRQKDGFISHFSTIARDISDLKQAETALQQLNQELEAKVKERTQALWQVNSLHQAILDGADYALISTDLNGVIQTFNKSAERMLGYSASEVVGQCTPAIIHDPQELVNRAAIVSLELELNIPISFEVFVAKARLGIASEDEWTYIRKDGSRLPVLLSVTALTDVDRQIIGFLGIAQDISDRKLSEEKLRKSDIHLKTAQRIGKLGSWEFDPYTDQIIWSDEVFRIFGRDPAMGTPSFDELQEQIHPDDRAHHQQVVQTAIANIQSFALGFRFFRSDGLVGYIQSRGEPVVNATGQLTQLIGTILDITDRKQAEEALRESEELKKRILESSSDCIKLIDLDGRLQYMNAGGQCIMEIDDFSLFLNADWVSLWPETSRLDMEAAIATAKTGQTGRFQGFCPTAKGTPRWWDVVITPIFDESGQISQLLSVSRDISDRKQAEQEILENQRFIQKIAEATPNILYLYDLQEHCNVYSNREIAAVLGYTPTEIQAMGSALFANLMHPEDIAKIPDYYRQIEADREGEIFEIEYRMRHANGEWRWLYSRDTVFSRDDLGQIKLTIGTAQDISDRKQKEQQLKQQLTAIEAAVDGIAILKDDCYVYLNSSHVNLFGFDRPQDLLGKNWRMLYSPEELQRIEREVFPVLGKNRHWEGEAIAIRKDGTTFIEGLSLTLTEDNLLICVCRDVSARKQQEEDLQNLSDRLALAAKSSAMGIWDWDVVHNILTWDDRMYELYGITPDRFTSVYDAWASSLHPDDRTVTELAIQQALTGEKDYDPEFQIVHPDGTIRFIQGYAIVQRNEQGEPQHMIGANFDISDRKQSEVTIQQTAAQLEASNRELEAFAYSVSHDLRSPLRAIDGFSNALIEDYGDRFDDDAKDYFDRIRHNIQRMGMLIDDLLRLSRVSRSEMQYGAVNLSAMFQEQMDELQAIEPERQVKVAIAPNIIVSADRTLMQVAISNLVQNAWKFTSHHNSALIEFGVLQQEDHLTYFVRDDGAGFDMAFANMLFGVFQRLHNTNEFPGTGIGLATVQRAIHRHGGRVWAEGVVEQGATIYFTVPHTSIKKGV